MFYLHDINIVYVTAQFSRSNPRTTTSLTRSRNVLTAFWFMESIAWASREEISFSSLVVVIILVLNGFDKSTRLGCARYASTKSEICVNKFEVIVSAGTINLSHAYGIRYSCNEFHSWDTWRNWNRDTWTGVRLSYGETITATKGSRSLDRLKRFYFW